MHVRAEVRRFYDGGVPASGDRPGEAPDPDRGPRIVLERHAEAGVEQFALLRRLAYLDRHLGELLVPADPERFRTDLTSVPWLFTWLVPKTGAHLPAALLHDGLVHEPGSPPTYVSTDGHQVDRLEADRVFRDAMADTGTGVVRRWVVWAAVVTATLLVGRPAGSSGVRWWHRVAVAATLILIGYLGACATADLVDVGVPGLVTLPWMGERPLAAELVGGVAAGLVVPLLLGQAWGRFRTAGAVVGVLLALLLHVTVVLLALTLLYRAAEWLATGRPRAAVLLAAACVAASLVVVVARSW